MRPDRLPGEPGAPPTMGGAAVPERAETRISSPGRTVIVCDRMLDHGVETFGGAASPERADESLRRWEMEDEALCEGRAREGVVVDWGV